MNRKLLDISLASLGTLVFLAIGYATTINTRSKQLTIPARDDSRDNRVQTSNSSIDTKRSIDMSRLLTYRNDTFHFEIGYPADEHKYGFQTIAYTDTDNLQRNARLNDQPADINARSTTDQLLFTAKISFVVINQQTPTSPEYKSIEPGYSLEVYKTAYTDIDEWLTDWEHAVTFSDVPEVAAELTPLELTTQALNIQGSKAVKVYVENLYFTDSMMVVIRDNYLYKLIYHGLLTKTQRQLEPKDQQDVVKSNRNLFERLSSTFTFI